LSLSVGLALAAASFLFCWALANVSVSARVSKVVSVFFISISELFWCVATGSVSENLVAVAHACRHRHPSTGEAAVEQFIGGRRLRPERHGSDRAESVRIKNKKDIGRRFQDDVVRKLILGDDLGDLSRRLAHERPAHHL